MAVANRFGREASIYLGGFVAVGAIQFIALPIYSRHLGPEKFGLYSLTMAAVTVLASVMVVGGDVALARFWGDAPSDEEKKRLTSTWIAFLTAWSAVVAVIGCAAAPWLAGALSHGSDLLPLLIIGILGLVPAQLSRMLAQVLRNTFRPLLYSTALVITAALDVALGLLFAIGLGLGVYGILLGLLVGEALGALARVPMVRQYLGFTFDWGLLPPMLRFGAPLMIAGLASWAFTGADRLVLSAHAAAAEVGHYGLAVSLVAPLGMVTAALGQAWIPRIVQLAAADRGAAVAATSRAIAWAMVGLGVASMVLGALAPVVVRIVGGAEFAESAEALPLLALAAAFAGLAPFTGTGLTLAKRSSLVLVVTITAGLISLALLAVLVPPFGAVGAALSVAAALLVRVLLTLFFANRVYAVAVDRARLALMVAILAVQVATCTIRPSWPTVLVVTVASIAALLALAPRDRAPSDAR